ncbi:hypothetical protein ACMFMF_010764 [Clarireedia jacksonii]
MISQIPKYTGRAIPRSEKGVQPNPPPGPDARITNIQVQRSSTLAQHISIDVARLNDGSKAIRQLCHNRLDQNLGLCSRNIPITNGVLGKYNIVALLCSLSRGGAHTDMCHVASNHDFLPISRFEIFIQVGAGE